jgi:hypothetical protein
MAQKYSTQRAGDIMQKSKQLEDIVITESRREMGKGKDNPRE